MKHFKTVFYITAILCASIGIGALASSFTANNEHTTPTEAEARVSEHKQSKILVFSTIHSKCGHTTEYSDNMPVEFYSVNDLAASFPSWEITGGDESTLIFTRHADDICGAHYTAKSNGDRIVITSDKDSTVVYEFIVNLSRLTDDDKSALKNGVHLSGKDALTSFIEDYTS